jgi:hypothetical protein
MAKGRPRRRGRLEALQHVGVIRRLQQQPGRADSRQILLRGFDTAVSRDVVVQLRRRLRIAAGGFRCDTQPRQHAITRWRPGGEFGKGGFRFAMLVGFRKLGGLVERSASLGGFLRLQILVATPAAHRGDDQQRTGNDIDRVVVPQLLELIATYVLVDFIK